MNQTIVTGAAANLLQSHPAVTARPKPRASAWMSKRTAWFVLPRRAKAWVGMTRPGDWTTVTRTHDLTKVSTHSRARMARVVQAMKAQREANRAATIIK